MGTLFIVRDFYAKTAVREWMRWVARYTNRPAIVVHIDEHGAGVRTIVRAYSAYFFHFSVPAFSAAFFIELTISARR
jgi:hypothetical protein